MRVRGGDQHPDCTEHSSQATTTTPFAESRPSFFLFLFSVHPDAPGSLWTRQLSATTHRTTRPDIQYRKARSTHAHIAVFLPCSLSVLRPLLHVFEYGTSIQASSILFYRQDCIAFLDDTAFLMYSTSLNWNPLWMLKIT